MLQHNPFAFVFRTAIATLRVRGVELNIRVGLMTVEDGDGAEVDHGDVGRRARQRDQLCSEYVGVIGGFGCPLTCVYVGQGRQVKYLLRCKIRKGPADLRRLAHVQFWRARGTYRVTL